MNKKIFIKEIIIIPLLIFVLSLFFENLQNLNINEYILISDFFLSKSSFVFDEMKLFFNSVIILTLLEMFIFIKISEDHLIARIISIVFSLLIIFVSYSFIMEFNYNIIYILRVLSIYFGQGVYLLIRLKLRFKRANILSASLLILMTLFFVVYRYI